MAEVRPKMSIERFNQIKKSIQDIVLIFAREDNIENVDLTNYNKEYSLIEELEDALDPEMYSKQKEDIENIYNEIKDSDLSDIPFEEYEGFIDLGFDFTDTKANLDFNLINTSCRGSDYVELKSCNIKNFDFDSIPFDEVNSFDEAFIKENRKHFWGLEEGHEFPRDVRERYSRNRLTIDDVLTYNLKDIDINKIEIKSRNILKYVDIEIAKKADIELFNKLRRNGISIIQENNEKFKSLEEYESALAKSIRKTYDIRDNFKEDYEVLEKSEEARRIVPDLIIDFPEDKNDLKEKFYNKQISFKDLVENKEIFKNKSFIKQTTLVSSDSYFYKMFQGKENKIMWLADNFDQISNLSLNVPPYSTNINFENLEINYDELIKEYPRLALNILDSIDENASIEENKAKISEIFSKDITKEDGISFIVKKHIIDNPKLDLRSKLEYLLENGKKFSDFKEYLAESDLKYLTEISDNIDNLKDVKPQKSIKLPKDITIGMEIESEGLFSSIILNSKSIEKIGWTSKTDGSIPKGVEIVSSIMNSNDENIQNIYKVCNMLNSTEQYVTDKCGGHIHIGADYLKSPQAYKNLITTWCNTEEIMYKISNKSGEITREGAAKYSKLISGKVEKAIKDGQIDLENEDDLDKLTSELKNVQGQRYSGINFDNLGDKSKNTIEFRLANGTIDPDTWIENINLFGGLVKSAQELAEIQKKPENERKEEDNKKLALFDKINDPEASEKEVLDALLSLTVEEEDKHIYEERYDINNELFKENEQISSMMKEQASSEKIIPKKKVKETISDVSKEQEDEERQALGMLITQERKQNIEEKKKEQKKKIKEDIEERE